MDNVSDHPTNILNDLASKTLSNCKYYLPSEVSLTTNNIKLIHCNARSLKSKFDKFLTLLTSLSCQFDILGISETWLSDNIMSDFNIPGYNIVFNNRQNSRGGGVAMYIADKINYKQRQDLEINNDAITSKFIEVSSKNCKNIIIGLIYRTPQSNPNLYFDYFLDISSQLIIDHKKIVFLMGDFNIDLLKLNEDSNVNKFIDIKLTNFLYPLISIPTRITSSSSTLIDNMFCNNVNGCISGCIYSDFSDHSLIFSTIEFKCSTMFKIQKSHSYRKINDDNLLCFKQKLSESLPLISPYNRCSRFVCRP